MLAFGFRVGWYFASSRARRTTKDGSSSSRNGWCSSRDPGTRPWFRRLMRRGQWSRGPEAPTMERAALKTSCGRGRRRPKAAAPPRRTPTPRSPPPPRMPAQPQAPPLRSGDTLSCRCACRPCRSFAAGAYAPQEAPPTPGTAAAGPNARTGPHGARHGPCSARPRPCTRLAGPAPRRRRACSACCPARSRGAPGSGGPSAGPLPVAAVERAGQQAGPALAGGAGADRGGVAGADSGRVALAAPVTAPVSVSPRAQRGPRLSAHQPHARRGATRAAVVEVRGHQVHAA
jgi:hypothetical protein